MQEPASAAGSAPGVVPHLGLSAPPQDSPKRAKDGAKGSVTPPISICRWHLEPFPPVLLSAAVVCLFITAMLVQAGGAISLPRLLVLFAGAVVVTGSGHVLVSAATSRIWQGRIVVSTIVGFAATMGALLLGVIVMGMTPTATFLGWSVAVVIAASASLSRRSEPSLAPDLPDLVALACIAAVIGFSCRNAAGVIPAIKALARLPIWIDYYIHGTEIAQFGDPLAAGRGMLLLSDTPIPLYHYGTYMIPAALMGLFKLPGLVAAAAVLLPLGLLIAASGAYALGSALGGRWAGVLTTSFLVLVPDASAYGLHNAYFSFQWLMFASPTSGYALGIAAITLVCADRCWRRGEPLLVLSLFLALMLFQVRVHIFLVFIPAFALTHVASRPFVRLHPIRSLAFLSVLVTIIVTALGISPGFRHWLEQFSAAKQYLLVAHEILGPTLYQGYYLHILEALGTPAGLVAGALLTIPAILGVFTVLYPLSAVLALRRTGMETVDIFPLSLLVTYLGIVLLAPPAPDGDIYTEFQHRPFVLVYLIVAAFTAVYIVRLMPAKMSAAGDRGAVSAMVLVALAAIVVLAVTGFDPGRPRNVLLATDYDRPIDPTILAIADRMHRDARPGDTFAIAPLDPKARAVDAATELASISDIPAFLSRAAEQAKERPAVVQDRLRRLTAIESSPNLAVAYDRLRSSGITWFVVTGEKGLSFDPAFSGAAFRTSFGAVYLSQAPGQMTQARVSGSIPSFIGSIFGVRKP